MSAKTTQVKDKGKRTKKLDDEKEKELMDYLKKHFFLDKFKESVKEMIDMDPNLPKDPVKYIKNNIDYTYKEAREVERDLKMTKKAIAKFEEENAILKYQLELYEPSGEGSGSWSTTSRGEDERPRTDKKDSYGKGEQTDKTKTPKKK
uniref:Cation efflux system protein CusC n=1 Tax=Lygus hesperus TaxID=30085 RepID=A0A0A9YD10_LYGHE